MVGKTTREHPKTEEEQLSEAAKAAFRWQGTCYGALTLMSVVVIVCFMLDGFDVTNIKITEIAEEYRKESMKIIIIPARNFIKI